MLRSCKRVTAWGLVVSLLAGPLAPLLQAQDLTFADTPGTPAYDNYVSGMRDTLASREGMEDMYQRQAQRGQQFQTQIDQLQAAPVPPGVDPNVFNQQRQAQIAAIQAESARNNQALDRTRQRLVPVYQQLDRQRALIQSSNNDQLKQQIGTLLGAGGGAVVPIWTRITAADVRAIGAYGVNQAHLRTVDFRIPRYENIATNAASRAANAEAALGNMQTVRWVPEPHATGPNMQLRAVDAATGVAIEGRAPVETNIPARITNANGQVVDNPNAIRSGNDLAQIHNTRTQITNEISAARLKASRAINDTQRQFFENHAKSLTEKKALLEADITKYQAENPSMGARASALAKDAGKWAAMSVGIHLGANVINQLSKNGWDPSRIKWGEAASFLTSKTFWGGTAGSFVGSMAGSIIGSALPGGIFVKTALSIGGAALGYNWGSGTKTDWAALGVTTLGSTAGFLLGMSIGGPVGAFLGGIVGQYVSQFIYDKIKAMIIREEGASSYDPGQQQQGPPTVDAGQQAQYPGPNPGQVPTQPVMPTPPPIGDPGGGGIPSDVAQLTDQMNQIYVQKLEAERSNNALLAAQLNQEYIRLRGALQQMRQAAGATGPADFRNSR